SNREGNNNQPPVAESTENLQHFRPRAEGSHHSPTRTRPKLLNTLPLSTRNIQPGTVRRDSTPHHGSNRHRFSRTRTRPQVHGGTLWLLGRVQTLDLRGDNGTSL